jgi:predicted DNA-binding transcriptional regulator AlpA
MGSLQISERGDKVCAKPAKLPPQIDLRSDRVLDPRTAAAILGISLMTLQRTWARGEGPKRIQLSARRIGIRARDLLAYLER